jgi:short subunit dehydrogenase-like uncharacterized protein
VRRIVVAGGAGFFGSLIVRLLREQGMGPVVPGIGTAPMDVEDPASIRRTLRRSDVLVDATGPFQRRTATLIEAAAELGVDVIDINESAAYARVVHSLEPRISAAGIAVLTSCSAVSTAAAALVRTSGVVAPVRVSALVAPASRETARRGTVHALLASVGEPVEVWRNGRAVRETGWVATRRFRMPAREAHLVESALSVTLPPVWPSLREVDCWTDTGIAVANALLSLAARSAPLRRLARRLWRAGVLLARVAGPRRGAFAIEVEDASGRSARLALTAPRRSYLTAVAPPVLAARALAEGRFTERGLVPPDRHVPSDELFACLDRLGVQLMRG